MKRPDALITAGPTREPLDPVRFLSNRSSGRMGFALAGAARDVGMRVTLVTGPVHLPPPRGVRVIAVETAREMERAVIRRARGAGLIIMAAAVADYEPAAPSRQKIKKSAATLTLRLRKTPDILAGLGRRKKRGQILVGFAAETNDLIRNARAKLRAKNLDFIAANRVGIRGAGFEAEHNAVTLLARDGTATVFPRTTKARLAARLVRFILKSASRC